MAREDIEANREKLLKFLIALRDAGMETKNHIYDVFLDPFRNSLRSPQFVAAAIVSVAEILSEDFSALKTFTDYMHTISDPSQITSRVVHHDRVAVVKNAGEKYFFEHGECRLFDPGRKHLFKIIDEEVFSHTGRKTNKSKIKTRDKGGHGVFENMESTFKKTFHTLNDAVVLLYSFYIPCTIDFHNCAKLLHEFVNNSGHVMVVGYRRVFKYTDEKKALKSLENIIVLSNTEMKREIDKQRLSVMGSGTDDDLIRGSCKDVYEYDMINDDFDDIFVELEEVTMQLRKSGRDCRRQLRQYGRVLCRKIMEEYNECFR